MKFFIFLKIYNDNKRLFRSFITKLEACYTEKKSSGDRQCFLQSDSKSGSLKNSKIF